MNPWSARPVLDRYDRNVRRVKLRTGVDAPRHRLAFAMEEALRLLSLAGEDRGRAYYFRRLRVTALPTEDDRTEWQAKFQQTMQAEVRCAVHGADSRAASTEAVFFESEQEALETLLHRMLARQAVQEWFWPMVTGTAQPSVLDVVERLRALPASWVGVAASLFAHPDFDAIGLLRAIPQVAIEAWLSEMDTRHQGPQAYLPAESRWLQEPAVRSGLRVFGPENPGVVWLAALAGLLDSPSSLEAGVAVRRARIGLQRLAAALGISIGAEARDPGGTAARGLRLRAAAADSGPGRREVEAGLHFQAEGTRDAANQFTIKHASQDATQEGNRDAFHNEAGAEFRGATSETLLADRAHRPAKTAEDARRTERLSRPDPESPASTAGDAGSAPLVESGRSTAENAAASPAPTTSRSQLSPDVWPGSGARFPWLLSGAATRAAGLFFLLNAMQQIGIADAVSLSLAVPQLVPRVLLRLARQAGLVGDDPVVAWLLALIGDTTADDLPQPLDASFWPGNLQPPSRLVTAEDLIRAWSVAVRRWCWRLARVSTSEIVRRDGVFFVNRTDLDISLPIEAADVRIRKAGLDLDPGWLPWFGHVVRFHYLFPGELYG